MTEPKVDPAAGAALPVMTEDDQRNTIGTTEWYSAMRAQAQAVGRSMGQVGFRVTSGWIETAVLKVPARFQFMPDGKHVTLEAGAVAQGDGTPLNWDAPLYSWVFPIGWVS